MYYPLILYCSPQLRNLKLYLLKECLCCNRFCNARISFQALPIKLNCTIFPFVVKGVELHSKEQVNTNLIAQFLLEFGGSLTLISTQQTKKIYYLRLWIF